MRLAWLGVAALACGGAPVRDVMPASDEGVVGEAAGVRIVALPRATEGRVWLSLWVDAGARDADPTQVATLAAWAAADTNASLSARVLPDGTELARPCTRETLAECLRSLARAVSTRDVAESAIGRLSDARERSADDGRVADALAVEALLGGRVDPLGSATDDARSDATAVSAFLGQHFGPGRLLLVAIGDLEIEELRAEVERSFADVPAAQASRAVRSRGDTPPLRIEVGERSILAVAALRPNIADAAHLARRLVARVGRDIPEVRPRADVFPVRGGAALVARIEAEPSRASVLLDHLSELAEEPPIEANDPLPSEDGPEALARWIGVRWSARAAPLSAPIAIAAVVAGGRGDTLEGDPDRERRESARAALEEALGRASQPPAIEGRAEEERADVRLSGGARARVQRMRGASRTTAIVLFEGGASEDPREAHGATALLTALAALSCDTVARRELGHTLEALAIEVEPVLHPGAWGLRIEGPSARWRELAFLATRCPIAIDLAQLEAARERAMDSARAARASALAALAGTMSPAAPGRIAPDGDVNALSAISRASLLRLAAARTVAHRARLVIAGDVPVDGVLRALGRGAARWDEGGAAPANAWEEPQARFAAARHETVQAVVGWLVPDPSTELGALAFARAAARALEAEPGLRAVSFDAGALDGRAWAAVLLDATPDALDALPAHTTRALAAVSWADVAREASALAVERRAWRAATPRAVATELAWETAETDLHALLSRFAASTPYFVVRRPQPAER